MYENVLNVTTGVYNPTQDLITAHNMTGLSHILTFHLQFAVYLCLPKVVDGLAGVHASIKWAGLPNFQCTHTLIAEHAVAWVI